MGNRNTRGTFGRLALIIAAAAALMLASGAAMAAPLVDINSADVKALEALPGVGPAVAADIVKGRPYKSVDELARVKGIGKAKLAALKGMVTAGAAQTAAAPDPMGAAKGAASGLAGKAADAGKAAKAAPADAKTAAKAAAAGQAVNLNTAAKAQIEKLPGIGPVKAQAIIDGRPYKTKEDVMKIKGIKEGIYRKIEGLITVQ
jgi:competence protein ComEA